MDFQLIFLGLTFNLKSFSERYGALNGFRLCLLSVKLETFRQSKNLLNIMANFAVSFASSPMKRVNAFDTDKLRTYYSAANNSINNNVPNLSSKVNPHFRECS